MDVGELELLGKMLRHKDEAQVPVMTSSSKVGRKIYRKLQKPFAN